MIRRWFQRNFAIRTNGGHYKKPIINVHDAAAMIPDGASLLCGGFGLTGIPEKLLFAILQGKVRNLSIVSNDTGYLYDIIVFLCVVRTEDFGLGLLIKNNQVSKVTASYIGENLDCVNKYLRGELDVELVPQVKSLCKYEFLGDREQ